MNIAKKLPSRLKIHSLFRYYNGGLFWKTRSGRGVKVGDRAGYLHKSTGYVFISVGGVNYRAHRLIWKLVHGEDPTDQIDHINGVCHDNRITNLREACQAKNNKNKRLPSNNTSGVVGVRWHTQRGKWRAQIQVNGRGIHLGFFTEKRDAIAARKAAEKQYGYHENHGRAA